MTTTIIRVCVRIFNANQKDYLESKIRLCRPKLDGKWIFSNANEADIIFISPTETGADILLAAFLKSKTKIPVIYAPKNNTISPWFIRRPVEKTELVKLLNQLQLALNNSAKASPPLPTEISYAEKSCIKKNNATRSKIIKIIKTISHSKQSLRLFDTKNNECFYDPLSTIFYSTKQTSAKQISNISQFAYQPINDLEKIPNKIEVINLQELRWNLCRKYLNHKLFRPKESFRLIRWPDFSVLEHEQDDITIASFFLRYASTIDVATNSLDVSPESIYRFCHTANDSGFLKQGILFNKNTINSQVTINRPRQIIRSITKRLYQDID